MKYILWIAWYVHGKNQSIASIHYQLSHIVPDILKCVCRFGCLLLLSVRSMKLLKCMPSKNNSLPFHRWSRIIWSKLQQSWNHWFTHVVCAHTRTHTRKINEIEWWMQMLSFIITMFFLHHLLFIIASQYWSANKPRKIVSCVPFLLFVFLEWAPQSEINQ